MINSLLDLAREGVGETRQIIGQSLLEDEQCVRVLPILLDALGSHDSYQNRSLLARRIHENPRFIPPLIERLSHEEGAVRRAAAQVAGLIGTNLVEAIPRLEALLSESRLDIRQEAATAIWKISRNPRPLLTYYREVSRRPNSSVEWAAAQCAAELESQPSAAMPELISQFETTRGAERELIALVLGRLGKSAAPALPALSAAMADPEENVRTVVTNSMKSIQKALAAEAAP